MLMGRVIFMMPVYDSDVLEALFTPFFRYL